MPIKGLTDIELNPSLDLSTPVSCPLCEEPMHIVLPREGDDWKAFYGCDDFPDCEGSRAIKADGNPQTDDEALYSMEERDKFHESGWDLDDFFEFWYGGRY